MHRFGTHPLSARQARFARAGAMATVLLLTAPSLAPQAWAGPCEEVQPYLTGRRDLVSAVQAIIAGDKKLDPKAACTTFGNLAINASATLKWAEAMKDACKVPDEFIQSLKAEHDRVVKMREGACELAAKSRRHQDQLPSQARLGITDWMPHWLRPAAPDLSRGWIE
jgi:hypothetical protein